MQKQSVPEKLTIQVHTSGNHPGLTYELSLWPPFCDAGCNSPQSDCTFRCPACLFLSCLVALFVSYEHTALDPPSIFISNYLFTATWSFICFCNHQTCWMWPKHLSTLHHDNEHVCTKYLPWQLRTKRNTVSTETTKEKHNSRVVQHASFSRRWFILWTCGLCRWQAYGSVSENPSASIFSVKFEAVWDSETMVHI